MTYVLSKDKTTPSWVKYIRQRIRKNKNCLILIAGETGSGKSESSISIASMVDPTFTAERIVFGIEGLMELRKTGKLRKGSAIVYEEVGVEHDSTKWQSEKNRVLSYLLQTFRDENYVVIFNVPYMGLFLSKARKLLHAYFETVNIDDKKKLCKIKPFILQYNEWMDKTYKKYLLIKMKGQGMRPVKRWNIPQPDPILRREYLMKKAQYKGELDQELVKILKKEGKLKPKRYPQHCYHCNYSWKSVKEKVGRCARCLRQLYTAEEKKKLKK